MRLIGRYYAVPLLLRRIFNWKILRCGVKFTELRNLGTEEEKKAILNFET